MTWTIERKHDHVAVVTMSTNKVNAQNPTFFGDLHAAFDRRGDFVKELSDPAIEAHIEQAAKTPSELSLMNLYPIDGAIHRVGKEETAWSARDATWSMVIAGIDTNPQEAGAVTRWTKAYWEALHPFNPGGGYVNFMMDDEGDARVKATYGANYNRLAKLKKKYDPANLFRVNQNIRPAA